LRIAPIMTHQGLKILHFFLSLRSDLDVWDLLLAFVVILYLIVCPYTKVEESFNIQAIHDMLFHGTQLDKYDHHEFPGVVPRTFLGALIIAMLSKPLQLIAIFFGLEKFWCQILVRGVLGLILVWCFSKFRHQSAVIFGRNVGIWLIIIQCSQFHLNFYFSRTLPNTFALAFVLLAYSYWFQAKWTVVIVLLTFVAAVFRCEVLLLLGPLVLQALLSRQIRFWHGVMVGLFSAFCSIALSILIDSYFWGYWLWPEGKVFYFNTILNKSREWGTSPFYWYFLVAVPKTLMCNLPLIPIGYYFDWRRCFVVSWPIWLFLSLYSLLPHKEIRFIFYVFPILNLMAAIGINHLYRRSFSGRKQLAIYWFGLSMVIFSCSLSNWILFISHHNYPGGVALAELHKIENNNMAVFVHIDNLAAQTGVTRFGEKNPNWRYSKAENVTDLLRFTHLIDANPNIAKFSQMATIYGFSHISTVWYKGWLPIPQVHLEPKLYLYRNRQSNTWRE